MLVRLTIFGAATYYSIKWVVDAFDPTQKQKSQAKKPGKDISATRCVEVFQITSYFQ